MTLDNAKTKLFFVSFSLGIASTVALIIPNDNAKVSGIFGWGATVATLISSEITTSRGHKVIRDEIENATQSGKARAKELKIELAACKTEVASRQQLVNDLTAQLAALKPAYAQLQHEFSQLEQDTDAKHQALLAVKNECQELKDAAASICEFRSTHAFEIVNRTYETAMQKLEAQINGLHRNYPECQEDLSAVLVAAEHLRSRFLAKLAAYKKLETFGDLLDTGLELQELIINRSFDLRVKGQTIIIKFLNSVVANLQSTVSNSVPYSDYQAHIEDLVRKASHAVERATLEGEDNVKAIAQEFVIANNGHKANYQGELTDAVNTAKYAANKLAEAEDRLAELQRPLQMFGESTYANAANAIANYYYLRYQYLLDCMTWEETDTGYKVLFSTRRNPGLTDKEISADNSREQVAAFTNALHGTAPEFDFNRQNSTVTLTVVLRRAVKKHELPKGVKTADKFPSIVTNWKRIRITGGSESGKSPTAENLIVCLLLQHAGTVDFFDPMFDSNKNHRTIPAVGKTHADSIQGLKDYADKMATTPSEKFYLAWFDEIDTTLDINPKSASDLKAVLKQSSHKNSGLVITGQNANVRNLKGNFDRSDMNNFVCVHIGDNYKDAVRNSNLSESEQDDLMRKGDALKDWCLTQNEMHQLTNSDVEAHRFALVLEPNKRGYYILLPDFGTYTYDMVKTDTLDITPTTTIAVEIIEDVTCPQCASTHVKKNGMDNGKQKYSCKSCGENFRM